MEANAQNEITRPLTERQQRLLLRAVIGSLVLSAALASNAAAQQKTGVLGGGPTAQESPRNIPHVYAVPFRELLAKMRRLTEAGELSAQDSFELTVEAGRNPDGSLRDVRFTKAEGKNENWRKLAEEFVTILGDSSALSYLEDVERLTFTVKLADRLSAALAADAASEAGAKRLENNSTLLFDIARYSQQGRPGIEILNGLRASANGKRFAIKLDMTRAEVGNLLSQATAIP